MRIAFFVDCSLIASMDLSNLECGNPGIGGTEYAIISLVYFLTKRDKKNEYILFSKKSSNSFTKKINVIDVGDYNEVLLKAINLGIDILVVSHSEYTSQLNAFKIISDSSLRIILWVHIFISAKTLKSYSNCDYIKRIVFVGREMYDHYRDHAGFYKSTYIYNGINIGSIEKIIEKLIPYDKRENEVTYIGNIIYGKGFHILARNWKKVLEFVPNAHLNVIGSGKLYDRNAKMGNNGIAEEKYERYILKYLTNENGKILDSVTFHGILGLEKNEILMKTKVGVPNPSGYSETFGYTAVEMQAFGALITTKKCAGYLDTVFDTGRLYDNEKDITKNIVELLNCYDNRINKTIKFISQNFSFDLVCKKWIEQFEDIAKNQVVQILYDLPNPDYNKKWLREKNRKIKEKIPILKYFIPSLNIIQDISESFLFLIKRIIIKTLRTIKLDSKIFLFQK